MGFFSSIFKGIKKIFKGVKKVVKKVFKAVKKFAKSKIGKILIAAAAIYVGGGMLGAWSTPTWLGGAGLGAAPSTLGAGAGTALGATEGVTAAGVGLGGGTSALGVETAMAGTDLFATAAPGLVEGAVSTAVPAVAATALPATTTAATTGAGSSILNWMKENPALTIAGAKGVTAALAPDPYEEWKKKQDYLRSQSNIAGISGTGEGAPIGMGLIRQGQQADLYTPTYQTPG